MSGYSIPVNPLVFNLRSRPQNWSPSAGSPHGTDTLLQVYCIFRVMSCLCMLFLFTPQLCGTAPSGLSGAL